MLKKVLVAVLVAGVLAVTASDAFAGRKKARKKTKFFEPVATQVM
jgi:hypothetical protein